MNNTCNPLELDNLKTAIERLFCFQDKSLSEKKRDFIVRELINSGYKAKHIISALEYLKNKDLPNLKYANIETYISSFVARIRRQQEYKIKCEYCNGYGVISMADKDKYIWAYRCGCANGDKYKYLQLWNGEEIQDGRQKEVVKGDK